MIFPFQKEKMIFHLVLGVIFFPAGKAGGRSLQGRLLGQILFRLLTLMLLDALGQHEWEKDGGDGHRKL